LFRVAPDQRFDQGGLSHAGWADDADDNGGRFLGEAVDEGDMEALFFDL
jgi:hypothetical protein